MRLIRLKIRNIASLKGDHDIDFQEIQKESSLFAITGETGAGKSTILNCIGLALYGQIYKKNLVQSDVVTLGEKEGSVELIFQVKGKLYLADWRIRVRKQNGEPYSTPQSAVRNLYTLEAPEFTSPKNIATVIIPDLLNLDFDQYCKCIILNQGEFARFLTSSFTDRKEILEKLYPGELLDSISRELDQEKKSLEKAKGDIEIELKTLKGDDHAGDDLKTEKIGLEAKLKTSEETLKGLEKVEYHFSSLVSYHTKYAENENRKSQIKTEMITQTTKFNLLLKSGEEISERHQQIKTQHELEIPVLQTYLQKEGTLRLLEEAWVTLKKKYSEISVNLKQFQDSIDLKEEEERQARSKLSQIAQDIKLPLKDLKDAKDYSQELFDLFSEKEVLTEEIKGKALRLVELETSGKELKALLEKVEATIQLLPQDAPLLEMKIMEQKSALQVRIDRKQRAEIFSEELKKQIAGLQFEASALQENILTLRTTVARTQEDLFPLETTLRLQEVLNASLVCVDHVLASGKDACPVCESSLSQAKWADLKKKLTSTDLLTIKRRYDEGAELIFRCQKEIELLSAKVTKDRDLLSKKEIELSEFTHLIKEELPSLMDIEKELDQVRKSALELAQLKKEREQKNSELGKVRVQFKLLRDELNEREKALQQKVEAFLAVHEKLKGLIPAVTKDTVRELRNEVRLLSVYTDQESRLERITQEKGHLRERKDEASKALQEIQKTETEQSQKIAALKAELEQTLKGQKASDLIQKLNLLLKSVSEEWQSHSQELKRQELLLKDSQGRLYTLEELTKDFDLHFTKELHAVREASLVTVEREEAQDVIEKLRKLDLTITSPRELFIPINDVLVSLKEHYKHSSNELRMQLASASTKLLAWEKLQDRIMLLGLKSREISLALERKVRLFEVLGKDELRTFVLSLVEENLIHQTNEELQKLCQGRYEIIHQTKSMKMTPEFFILDKFREGGKRKVSTLSGGETFMVSLAMALGLAEMTRGKAEIDSLFIDEGFGTLDQDSLEDVLDMLQQIQNRGLMVGIISHIKPLTEALPVNLVVKKKSDGTSSIGLLRN